jgi:hypothetical protein
LQQIKIRSALRIHGNQFAIDYRPIRKLLQRIRHVLKFAIEHIGAPGIQRRRPAIFHSLELIAVQLDLVCPARTFGQRCNRQTSIDSMNTALMAVRLALAMRTPQKADERLSVGRV